MQDFRRLQVWQRAYRLTLDAYKLTRRFPREEVYGLTSQIRRGSVSIAANIAEGCGRQSSAELKRFLYIAMGSASELECLLLLAHDLGLATPALANQMLKEVTTTRRQINTFIQRLESARKQQPNTNNQ